MILPPVALPVAAPQTSAKVAGGKTTHKGKTPKPFRVPGERGRAAECAVVVTEARFLGTKQTSGGLNMANVSFRGRSVVPEGEQAPDGLAEMAAEMLAQGVLRESDWCGSLAKSVRRGVDRWAHEEMGAGGMRVLTDLQLVYTDDGPAYERGVRLGRWADYYHARRDRPIGFFGLRWGVSPRRVHVRRATLALEAAWPGYGFGLIDHLEKAFMTGVQGHSFHWGKMALRSNAVLLRQLDKADQNPFWDDERPSLGGVSDPLGLMDLLRRPDGLTEEEFFRLIPRGTVQHVWRLARAREIAAGAPRTHPALAPIAEAALGLWDACREAGLHYQRLNHVQWLSWEMTQQDMHTGEKRAIPIETLQRAPTCYTVWDDKDLMGRLVDDYHAFCRSNGGYTDLTFMHCFQVGHPGIEHELGQAQARRVERLVKKYGKTNPELVDVHDPDYVPGPMPDGGLPHAVTALRMAVRIVVALDRLLWLLDSMEGGQVENGLRETGLAEKGNARHAGS